MNQNIKKNNFFPPEPSYPKPEPSVISYYLFPVGPHVNRTHVFGNGHPVTTSSSSSSSAHLPVIVAHSSLVSVHLLVHTCVVTLHKQTALL